MKKLLLALCMLLIISSMSFAQLIISQYIETGVGSTPKGIELWNKSGATIDFSVTGLDVQQGTNGAAPASIYTLNTGTLADGAVMVIGTDADVSGTGTGFKDFVEANGAAFYTKAFAFNGDDALEIWLGGVKQDVFGDPGTGDPGTGWSGNGVQTWNQNISLLTGITTGTTTGWTDPSTRFETTTTDNSLTGFGIAPVIASSETADWCNLQLPASGTILTEETFDVYAQVYEAGITEAAGQGADIQVWIGYSTADTDPSGWTNWVAATYNTDAGNNDEYVANIGAEITSAGTYYYASRFSVSYGPYTYGGYNGGIWDGTTNVSGVLTVNARCADPSDLVVLSKTTTSVQLTWTENATENTWSVKHGVTGFDPYTEGVLHLGASVRPYNVYGLTASTTYDLYVEATCGSNSWFGPTTFTTTYNQTDITSFSFAEQTGPATFSNDTIYIEVAGGSGLTNLIASFTLSTGATAEISGTPQVSGVTPNDFSSFVTYTVTAEDAITTKDWIVSVSEQGVLSSEAEIYAFSFAEQMNPAVFSNDTIYITVNPGTDIANLIATFSLSAGANAEISGTPQVSGVTPNDFSSFVTYTVTAEDAITTKNWIVSVTEFTIPYLIINEVDADPAGTDYDEFIELYDGGVGNTSLDGFTVVLYNGNGDVSYNAIDLDGYSTGNDGYFVIGSATVANVDLTAFTSNSIQNGQDAVALYFDDAANFPTSTVVTDVNLIDALVYGTSDPDATNLIATLLNGGELQVDENINANSANESMQRIPNGTGGERNTSTYMAVYPTPGAENIIPEIDWCNLQLPDAGAISVGDNFDVYARVYEMGITDAVGQGAGIEAWIGYSTTDTDPSTWTNWVTATFNADDGVNNDEYVAEIGSGLTAGTYYYASRFRVNGGTYSYGGYNGGVWDGTTNVSGVLTVNTPPCNDPISLDVINVIDTSAVFTWHESGTATLWNVQWDVQGFTLGFGYIINGITDTTYQLNGLLEQMSYDYYVQADCGGGNTSAWVGPFTFTTACSPVNTFPYNEDFEWDFVPTCWSSEIVVTDGIEDPVWSGTAMGLHPTVTPSSGSIMAQFNSYNCPSSSSARLSTGLLDFTGRTGMTLTFMMYHDDAYSSSNDNIQIQASLDGINWVNVDASISRYSTSVGWVEHSVSLSAFDGLIGYIGILATSDYGNDIYIDNFTIKEITCPAPSTLSATNITATSADLTWITGSASTWDILFGETGFDTTGVATYANDITNNPYSVGALNPETSYDFYVRDVCAVDDVSNWVGPYTFTTLASCPAPSDLIAENITLNSADLSWNGYIATNWDVLFVEAGFDTTGLAPTYDDNATNSIAVNSLTSATTYEFYVRADCGNNNIDVTDWVGPFQFTTACDVITAFPWSESFEGGFDFTCWTNTGSSSYIWETNAGTSYGPGSVTDGTTAVMFNVYNAARGDSAVLTSPTFDLTSLANPFISFDYWMNGSADVDLWLKLEMTTDGSNWTEIFNKVQDGSISAWTSELISLAGVNATTEFRFIASSDYGSYNTFVDNLSIINLSCPVSTDLSAINITTNEATLTWTSGGANNFNVEYGLSGFTQGEGTIVAVTDTFVNITGLTASTVYDFYVQDSCGVGDVSSWVGYTFSTECEDVVSYPYIESFETSVPPVCWSTYVASGTNDWELSTNQSIDGSASALIGYALEDMNVWLISNTFNLSGMTNPRLTYADQVNWASYAEEQNVLISTDYAGDPTTATWNQLNIEIGAEDTWTEYEFNLSAYVGSNVNIAFQYVGNNASDWYIDNFVIEETPPSITDFALIFPANTNYYDCSFTGNDTIPFMVQNVGDTIIPSGEVIYAWYILDGAPAVADTFTTYTDVNPMDTISFLFSQTANLGGLTTHTYQVYFNYENDAISNNDTTTGTVTHYMASVDLGGVNDTIIVPSYPYVLDAGAGYSSYLWNDNSTLQTLNVTSDGWYSVNVIDTNGCDAYDSVYVSLFIGINPINAQSVIGIYPNPNTGNFVVNISNIEASDVRIEMLDFVGKVISIREAKDVTNHTEEFDVTELAKGIYFVRVSDGSNIKVEKVIIQ